MRRPTRLQLVHGSLALFACALVLRAAQVQLFQADAWRHRAQRQQFAAADVPAPRGNIFDVGGVPIAQSRPTMRLRVAPKELTDRAAAARALAKLGVPREWVTRATDARRAWVEIPGAYLPGDAAAVTHMRGVYSEPGIERVYTQREAMRRLVGVVDARGVAVDGLELTLDSLLRGEERVTRLARDSHGARIDAPTSCSPLISRCRRSRSRRSPMRSSARRRMAATSSSSIHTMVRSARWRAGAPIRVLPAVPP
jgi:cell division protein FtsI (penicillin-binding protein 3)